MQQSELGWISYGFLLHFSDQPGLQFHDLLLFSNNSRCGNRNVKVIGDGFLYFTFNRSKHKQFSEVLRQFSPLLSLLDVQSGVFSDTELLFVSFKQAEWLM